jgi:hypothetical protein
MQQLSPETLELLRRLDAERHPDWMRGYLRPLHSSAMRMASIVPDGPELRYALQGYVEAQYRALKRLHAYMADQ